MFGAPERSLGCWSEEKEVVGCVEACKQLQATPRRLAQTTMVSIFYINAEAIKGIL